jgi:hypothetical protein
MRCQFMNIMTRCAGWVVPYADPPDINWDTFPTGDREPVTPAFPILWVSSSHDPVTPLQQALLMSTRFANSSVIEQLSDGHCSLSAVSLCSLGKIAGYLNWGIVPKQPDLDTGGDKITGKWETCKADETPWHPYGSQQWHALRQAGGEEPLTAEDAGRMEAWKDVQKVFRDMHVDLSMPRAHAGVRKVVKMEYEDLLESVQTMRDKEDGEKAGEDWLRWL